ncbi:F0F1 ATP synthase subunit A [Elizabethkingia argentiflava]|uniref:ATP synthase subunit a n=1 Tax=Elizabethkingia argenteiflava TaxID=2681556 RepID=A0A845PVI3_9FLAO|nr:F0F1 ATP synthase subunit A [Elizabethkingia argenteiflava]NAW51143.1 F0F1 ATP synthase subunit A [Elizabethkingia argenteiflava]
MNVKKILYLITFLVAGFVFASSVEEQPKSDKYNPVPDIMHHISDSHSWHFWGEGENAVSISLPVILWDNGLHIFSSAKFGAHEDQVAKIGENYYKIHHNKIYKTDQAGTLDVQDGELGHKMPLDFSITKVVAQMLLAALIMILLAFATKASYKKSEIPSGVAKFIEPLIVFVRDDIALQNIGSVKYKRFVPYLVTLFLFLWLMNILGLLPGSANVTGNIAFTMVLAVLTFLIVNINGRKTYWSHILDPLGNNMPWVGKILVYIILVPVEILGMFTKPIALMIRLFANMTAGHIVILSLVSLIFIMQSYAVAPVSVALTLFINVLEVLVAALQAYIFTLLTALFIGMAVEEPHHAH